MRIAFVCLLLLGPGVASPAAPPKANFAAPQAPAVVNDWSRDEFQFQFGIGSSSGIYLYIPAQAKKVRALFLLQQNVSEQMIAVHPAIRKACDANDVAIAWCKHGIDATFNLDRAGERHDLIQREFGKFGKSIGYAELGDVPLITFGHSATNAYAQNAAEAKPERVLAVLATHGWNGADSFHNYKGPLLLFIGHYWEQRQQIRSISANKNMQSLAAVNRKLKAGWMPITVVEEYGSGHFDYSDRVVEVFGMFIDKAVKARLDKDGKLKDIDPNSGYVTAMPSAPSGPISVKPYKDASPQEKAGGIWFFGKELSEACVKVIVGNGPWNRACQLIGYNNPDGTPAPFGKSGLVNPLPYQIVPGTNEFKAFPVLLDAFPTGFNEAGQPIGISSDPTITMEYVTGPYIYLDQDAKYRLKMNRGGSSGYLVARNLGDKNLRPTVQPTVIRVGSAASPTAFNPGDQKAGSKLTLPQKSSKAEFIGYYVDHGPARVVGDTLEILPLPANTPGPAEVELATYTLTSTRAGTASAKFYVTK